MLHCIEIGRGLLFIAEKIHNEEEEMGEGQSPGHKLTDNITDKIIMSETLTEKISCHCMIFLFKSHCNTYPP